MDQWRRCRRQSLWKEVAVTRISYTRSEIRIKDSPTPPPPSAITGSPKKEISIMISTYCEKISGRCRHRKNIVSTITVVRFFIVTIVTIQFTNSITRALVLIFFTPLRLNPAFPRQSSSQNQPPSGTATTRHTPSGTAKCRLASTYT